MPRKLDDRAPKTAEEIEAEAAALERANKRKQKALKKAAELDGESGDEFAEDGDIPGQGKVAELVDQLGACGSCDISRVENGRVVQVGSYDVTSLKDWKDAMDSVLRQKGGGDYLTVFRDGAGHQIGRIKRTYDPQIYKPEGQSAVAAASATSADAMMMRFMEIQQAADARHREEMAAMRAELARIQAESQKTLIEVFKSQNQGFLKNAQELAVLKNLFAPASNPLDQVLDLRELLDELRGDVREESAPAWEKLINGVIAGLAKAAPAQEAPRRAHTSPAQPAPKLSAPNPGVPPSPAIPPAKEPAASGSSDAPLSTKPSLEQYRDNFKTAIQAGHGPERVAELVRSQATTPAEIESLSIMLADGDWDGLLADEFLSQHKSWFETFRKNLSELLKPAAA